MSGTDAIQAPGANPRSWDLLARAAAAADAAREGGAATRLELLAFRLAGDPHAIAIERVREIVRMRPVTRVPRVPAVIRGVISLRGEIVQVLDLRMRLGMEASEPKRSSRIIVLHGDEGEVCGLLVDTVDEVLRVEESALVAPGPGESGCVASLCARGDEFVSLLDLEKVLDLGAA